jgi:O-antigen/teichoic acid export membrane protein
LKLGKSIAIYLVGGVLAKIAAFLLLPIQIGNLSVEQYGKLELLMLLHSLLVIVTGMQIESAIAREMGGAVNRNDDRQIAWSALLLTVGISILVIICLLQLPEAILAETYGLERTDVILVALTAILVQLFGEQQVILRFKEMPTRYATISTLDLLLLLSLNYWFVEIRHLGPRGAILSLLIGKTLSVALGWRYTFGIPTGMNWNKERVVRMASYATPLVLPVLLSWSQGAGNRLLQVGTIGLGGHAQNGLAIRIASVVGLFAYAFRLAWEPLAFKNLDGTRDADDIHAKAQSAYFQLMFVLSGIASIASMYLMPVIVPMEYGDAVMLTPLHIFSQFWQGSLTIVAIGIHGARATSRLVAIFLTGALLNLALFKMLFPVVGNPSTALAALLSSIYVSGAALTQSNIVHNTGLETKLFIGAALGTVVFCVGMFSSEAILNYLDFGTLAPLARGLLQTLVLILVTYHMIYRVAGFQLKASGLSVTLVQNRRG